MQPDEERRALTAVSYAISEKLEIIDAALQDVNGSAEVGWRNDCS